MLRRVNASHRITLLFLPTRYHRSRRLSTCLSITRHNRLTRTAIAGLVECARAVARFQSGTPRLIHDMRCQRLRL